MKKLVVLFVALLALSISDIADAQENVIVTKQQITAYKAVIEFDLREQPTPATVVSFDVSIGRRNR